ncbi:triose-phosphate isomerase [Desulfatirhabdium butyrativorans]|uniref:triose-phosphate isomerase n=1 Tax=Desulfatirhabdium butyrativorans TaxID=340467 RepID=UPI001B7FC97F|nr:triose-phosphate isomerase [Desulfatirhabdium butyrativorans]
MERRPLVAANWKMYKTVAEAVDTAHRMCQRIAADAVAEVMVAPTFVSLAGVGDAIRGSNIVLGAQNMHWEKEGAFTGEVSAAMLQSVGCRYVILGHSERRQFFGETDQSIHRKIVSAFQAGLVPVFCIGETEAERDSPQTFAVLERQLGGGLGQLNDEEIQSLVIAYEPVWAIGTGKTASNDQIQEVHAFLRRYLADQYNNALAKSIRILYGGSVKPGNATQILALPDVDGALVGGASLDAESFARIVESCPG